MNNKLYIYDKAQRGGAGGRAPGAAGQTCVCVQVCMLPPASAWPGLHKHASAPAPHRFAYVHHRLQQSRHPATLALPQPREGSPDWLVEEVAATRRCSGAHTRMRVAGPGAGVGNASKLCRVRHAGRSGVVAAWDRGSSSAGEVRVARTKGAHAEAMTHGLGEPMPSPPLFLQPPQRPAWPRPAGGCWGCARTCASSLTQRTLTPSTQGVHASHAGPGRRVPDVRVYTCLRAGTQQ